MNSIRLAPATPHSTVSTPVDNGSRELTTRSGYVFRVRPAIANDAAGLTEFFTHVTPEDLRFRFLSAIKTVGQDQIERLTHVDHQGTESYIVLDPLDGTMVATGMLAADPTFETAEVAIAIHKDFKHRGIGWTLLEYIAAFARSRGIKSIESLESRDNHQAIELEREMGFKPVACADDPSSIIVRLDLS